MTREKASILILDEHRMFAEGLRAMLMIKKHLGDPKIANSPDEAMEFIEDEHFDLLVTERNSTTDRDYIQKVKNKYPELKILLLTRQDDPDNTEFVNQIGAEGFIPKDSSPDQFLLAIESILFEKVQPREF
jgi:DNA-binding NarL/FixJ family response regulator